MHPASDGLCERREPDARRKRRRLVLRIDDLGLPMANDHDALARQAADGVDVIEFTLVPKPDAAVVWGKTSGVYERAWIEPR